MDGGMPKVVKLLFQLENLRNRYLAVGLTLFFFFFFLSVILSNVAASVKNHSNFFFVPSYLSISYSFLL